MAKNQYFINHDKSRDACSIIWLSDKHHIDDLEPYLFLIQCDNEAEVYDLVNIEWPEADGRDEFKTLALNNFQALEGDEEQEYILCFNAIIQVDLDSFPEFKNALECSDNHIVARVQFKKDGNSILDSDGFEETLYEPWRDHFVKLESIDESKNV